MKFLLRWAVITISLWVAVQIVPGLEHTGTALSLIGIALIFGLINAFVRPLLVLLTCPLIVVTLGLFVLIVNTIMLSLTIWLSRLFDLGLVSSGFWATFFGALVISVVSGVISVLLRDDYEERRAR